MKQKVLHAALLALMTPLSLYGMGLGQMTVKSALDQLFIAEVELIDVGSTPLSSIKVGVADPDHFEEVGANRAAVLSLLNFKIDRNVSGKTMVYIYSQERIVEPFMELVIDLTWPKGQVYKAYNILLDPPGYHLSTHIKGGRTYYSKITHRYREPGANDQTIMSSVSHQQDRTQANKKESSYGPTVSKESVWQIAQRYKTSSIILPQVVLAIVGANPDAFTNGNLNGLKVGVRLSIPATQVMALVPADLATSEVMAHDKAWNEKTAIDHLLLPPYTTAPKSTQTTEKAPVGADSLPNLAPITEIVPTPVLPATSSKQTITDQTLPLVINAAVSGSHVQAPSVVQESQIPKLPLDQLTQAPKKAKKTGVPPAVKKTKPITPVPEHASSLPLYLIASLLGAGFLGLALWYFRRQRHGVTDDTVEEAEPLVKPTPEPIVEKPEVEVTPVDEFRIDSPEEMMAEEPVVEPIVAMPVMEPIVAEELPPVVEPTLPDQVEKTKKKDLSAQILEAIGEPLLKQETGEEKTETPLEDEGLSIEESIEFQVDDDQTESKPLSSERTQTIKPESEAEQESDIIEFETGLHLQSETSPSEERNQELPAEEDAIDFVVPEQSESKKIGAKKKVELEEDHSIEFDHQPVSQEEKEETEVDDSIANFFADPNQASATETDTGETASNVASLKNKRALDTLLDLAKTYIGMEDFEAARTSLEEVIAHGSQKQKTEAERLLTEINDKL